MRRIGFGAVTAIVTEIVTVTGTVTATVTVILIASTDDIGTSTRRSSFRSDVIDMMTTEERVSPTCLLHYR